MSGEDIRDNQILDLQDTTKELKLQIEELEKKVNSLDMEKKLKIDYMMKMNQLVENDKAHQALYDKIFEDITTLRSDLLQETEYRKYHDHNIKEGLRELSKKMYDYIGAKNFGSWNDFLANLSGSGGDSTDDSKTYHPNQTTDDSKPPEPSRCKSCGEILTYYSKNQRGELVCPSCWISKEPREDLYSCRLCGNEITLVEHEVNKLTVEVKREDLQWLIERIDTYHISKEKDTYERIKEEYSL